MGQPQDTPADLEFPDENVEVAEENDGDIPGTGEDAELDEVDVADAEEDEAEEVDTSEAKPKGAKKATKKAAKARPPVPDGYIAPVAFAKKLTTKLIEQGRLEADEEIPPQMIYSYIKNSAAGQHPLPSYSEGGRENLLKEDEAFAWWDAKEERAKARQVAKKAKAAKKAAGAAVEETEETESEGGDVEATDVE